MTKTTKSERKWGKKEPIEEIKKPRKTKKIEHVKEDMYKILVDGSGFTKEMNYADCQKFINMKESDAKRLNRKSPSLVLVKQ